MTDQPQIVPVVAFLVDGSQVVFAVSPSFEDFMNTIIPEQKWLRIRDAEGLRVALNTQNITHMMPTALAEEVKAMSENSGENQAGDLQDPAEPHRVETVVETHEAGEEQPKEESSTTTVETTVETESSSQD